MNGVDMQAATASNAAATTLGQATQATTDGASPLATPTVAELPDGWKAAKDPASGREYYYHAATQQTTWERPTK